MINTEAKSRNMYVILLPCLKNLAANGKKFYSRHSLVRRETSIMVFILSLRLHARLHLTLPWAAVCLNKRIDKVIGVMKSFSSCVGAGPFVEMPDEEAGIIKGNWVMEYGASTGRPRRIGHFDAVATRYGAMVQGVDEIT
ncbi:MAG: adenylosuccinate synthetase [Ignavibacteria bacterium]